MTAPTGSTTPIPETTPAQQHAFCRLRNRYQHDHDRLTPQEWNQLELLRWLYAEGEGGTPTPDHPTNTTGSTDTSRTPWAVRPISAHRKEMTERTMR
jgi:hypothetical protein